MARCPFAIWRPLPENAYQRRIDPDQAIVHSGVDAPGRTSLFGYFGREIITVESHFWIYSDGTIEQYMDTNVRADANGDVNNRAISIETEDDGDPDRNPFTGAQVASLIRLLTWITEAHPKVTRRQCPGPFESGIGWHSMWGAPSPWTPVRGKTCPGVIRIPQVRLIIAAVRSGPAQEDNELTNEQAHALARIDDLIQKVNHLIGNNVPQIRSVTDSIWAHSTVNDVDGLPGVIRTIVREELAALEAS